MTASRPEPSPGPRAGAAVLAGGLSRRMGAPKAGALLAGRPLIARPLAALRAAGLDPFVVTKADRPVAAAGLEGPDGLEVVVEPDRPRHPLVGVLAALERAGGPVVVVACDLPLLPPPLLAWLAERPGGTVVPRAGGHMQPLAARYGPEAAGPVRAGIERGRAMKEVVAALGPEIVEEAELRRFGDPALMFENVNSPEDLARVESLLGGG